MILYLYMKIMSRTIGGYSVNNEFVGRVVDLIEATE